MRYGYEGPHWCCYLWTRGWRRIALGMDLDALSGCEVTLWLPFSLVRFGYRAKAYPYAKGWVWGDDGNAFTAAKC